MQFRDLKRQYRSLKKDIDDAVLTVMEDANFIMGKQVQELESSLAQYVGRKYCVTCANGTDALSLALMALDIKEGDAVFVPDFTFFSTAEIVAFEGATPVFVDVDEETFNISVRDLEQKIVEIIEEGKIKPRAIIPVDLFGQVADYEKIQTIADKYQLTVIEDGAQGFGGRLNGKKACSFGTISTTSFFPAKPLGCYGDGGAVFTDDDNIYELLKSYRIHGKGVGKYDNVRIGVNSRLDTMQAAILLVKLKAFEEYELENVNVSAQKYTTRLKEYVRTPMVKDGYYSSWAQYTIILSSKQERDQLQEFLKGLDIPSMVYYPKAMHQQTAFKALNYNDDDYPIASFLCEHVLSLPIHPYMDECDIKKVSEAVVDFVKNYRGVQ